MATAFDIILDDNNDLTISSSGDFEVNESDYQSSVLIINTFSGNWKFDPVCGVGISRYKGSSNSQLQLKREISVQLQADGYRVNSVIVRDYSDFYYDLERINL